MTCGGLGYDLSQRLNCLPPFFLSPVFGDGGARRLGTFMLEIPSGLTEESRWHIIT
jgi:hypothetical protein